MQHAIVIFRIKWVWIWLRLSGTRVPSRGAFFGRIEYPRSQKKKRMHYMSSNESYLVYKNLVEGKCPEELGKHHSHVPSSPQGRLENVVCIMSKGPHVRVGYLN